MFHIRGALKASLNSEVLYNMGIGYLQGKKNPGTDSPSVELFLNKVRTAKEMKIDRYIILQVFYNTSTH